jgi:uncharacterized protein (DUF302 family)
MNLKAIVIGIGGFFAGLVFVAVLGFYSLPGMMLMEDESRYGFDETVEVFKAKVDEAGWSVLQVHDMKSILSRHGHDVDNVQIFELCSSKYSAEILNRDDERIVAPLMPCRVAIYEKSSGKTYITRMDSKLMARPFGGVVNDVMQKAAIETEEIIAQLIR